MIGYKVYRDAGSGTEFLSAADPTCGRERHPAPQTCTMTGLTPGEQYQVRMLATNDVGDGELSDIFQFKAATVPAKITTLLNTDSATSNTNCRIKDPVTTLCPADEFLKYSWNT